MSCKRYNMITKLNRKISHKKEEYFCFSERIINMTKTTVNTAAPLLEVKDIVKIYRTRNSDQQCRALNGIGFKINKGEFVAIMGESGSGKTTLLNLLAVLDIPTEGTITIGGQNLVNFDDKSISRFRRENLGFVFQEFNLLDNFTLQENIALPLVLSGMKKSEIEKKISPIAEMLNIKSLLDKYPYQVSGGEKQRAAIARAVIVNPKILLADEPTGALDSNNSKQTLEYFQKINKETDQTIVMVTHSMKAALASSRVLVIKDGIIENDIKVEGKTLEQLENEISVSLKK